MEVFAVAVEILGGSGYSWEISLTGRFRGQQKGWHHDWQKHILALYLSWVLLTLGFTFSLFILVVWDSEDEEAAVRKAESTSVRVNLALALKILASSFKIPIWVFNFLI